jgi:hypothetical protein
MGQMMPRLVKKNECERISTEPRVESQSTVDSDDTPAIQLNRLGIDDLETQMEIKNQLGERLPNAAKKPID